MAYHSVSYTWNQAKANSFNKKSTLQHLIKDYGVTYNLKSYGEKCLWC